MEVSFKFIDTVSLDFTLGSTLEKYIYVTSRGTDTPFSFHFCYIYGLSCSHILVCMIFYSKLDLQKTKGKNEKKKK